MLLKHISVYTHYTNYFSCPKTISCSSCISDFRRYLFTFFILFLCLFPFCLDFVLSHEALLFLHCLIESKSFQSYPNHIYDLKWYILHCLIYFGFFECLYMHLIYQTKQEIARLRELEVELTFSPHVWGSRFSMSSFVYSLKRCQFIGALCRSFFTKYAYCKPLFPFQKNA